MTKQEFREFIKDRMVFLDGATGSNLMLRGMPGGVCPEKWIMENTQVLIGLQKEYVAAGANILYAPTFTANRCKLKEYGLEGQLRQINAARVAASKEAAGGKALVAGDLTMTGEQLAPIGSMDFEELIDIYKEQIACIEEAGADLLVVETMMSLQESRAALLAAKEICPDLPVMVTMTFEGDGRSLYGTDAATAAVVLESLGAAAIGANCSTGPEQMAGIIRQMASVTRIPVIAKPNAGLPSLNEEGKTVYEMRPREFAEEMQAVYEAGASIIGGCCGTTPEHIADLHESFAGKMPAQVNRRPSGIRYLTSERKTIAFGLDDPFLIIGERINPTGKKKLQEVREGELRELLEKAKRSSLAEDAQAARDLDSMCTRFERKIHDLELTRTICIQTAPQIRLVQSNDTQMAEKIQSTLVNTVPLWKSQMVLALGVEHSAQAARAQREVTDMTNELLRKNAERLKMATIETARESERAIVDIETLKATNESLISTFDEVLKIQQEGREKRREAEVEIRRLENELKEKLLEIRG